MSSNNELLEALTILEKEKNIPKETLLDAIENSLITACKNHFGKSENIKVQIDPVSCEFHVFQSKTVVEQVEDIPDKSVLVLAGNGIGSDLKQRVVEFNRSSEEYRIVVKDYSMYASYDDYTAGITQLNNDIISGKMPDIMIASDNLPTEVYASKGWLADIGKLIKEDEELSQVEFLENVFNAYSMNGKLIYVVPRFNIVTMIGKKSIVGDGASWTMEDAMKRIEGLILCGKRRKTTGRLWGSSIIQK